jgi:hypothetical protein
MGDSEKQFSAAYLPWMTFQNSIINGFAQGLPNVIDKSLFLGQSGAVQGQIMAGLKFLGLIEDNGKPTRALHELVDADSDGRKRVLAKILKERYSDVFAIGIEKATAQQLADTMSAQYGVSGDTREKAVRFFLSAAKFAEIPVSPHLQKNGGAVRTRRSSGTRKPRVETQPPVQEQQQVNPTGVGTSQTIKLSAGGTVTLTVSVDVIKLRGEDRVFVFGLIDTLADYESKHKTNDASVNVEDEDDDTAEPDDE